MYDSFFDELEKIGAAETKKPNWGRRAAIGGATLGTALAGGYALKRGFGGAGKAGKVVKGMTKAAPDAAVRDAAVARAQMIVDRLSKLGI